MDTEQKQLKRRSLKVKIWLVRSSLSIWSIDVLRHICKPGLSETKQFGYLPVKMFYYVSHRALKNWKRSSDNERRESGRSRRSELPKRRKRRRHGDRKRRWKKKNKRRRRRRKGNGERKGKSMTKRRQRDSRQRKSSVKWRLSESSIIFLYYFI